MKRVIKEVKDFKPYIKEKTICLLVSLFLAFLADYVPFEMGVELWICFLLYLLFFIYAYLISCLSYKIILPPTTRVRKADFDNFLINQGKDININRKRHIRPYRPFSKKIKYSCYTNTGYKAMYIFDVKNNSTEFIVYSDIKKKK